MATPRTKRGAYRGTSIQEKIRRFLHLIRTVRVEPVPNAYGSGAAVQAARFGAEILSAKTPAGHFRIWAVAMRNRQRWATHRGSLANQTRRDVVGLLPGRRHGGVAGTELVAEFDRPDPVGDGPPALGQDGAKKSIARLRAVRRSRTDAIRENHWHGTVVGCEDVIAVGSVQ